MQILSHVYVLHLTEILIEKVYQMECKFQVNILIEYIMSYDITRLHYSLGSETVNL